MCSLDQGLWKRKGGVDAIGPVTSQACTLLSAIHDIDARHPFVQVHSMCVLHGFEAIIYQPGFWEMKEVSSSSFEEQYRHEDQTPAPHTLPAHVSYRKYVN